MPAFAKDQIIKRIPTPTRVYPKSLSNHDVKRLGPTQRINSKRVQTQSTQTALACVILNNKNMQIDEATQTGDISENDAQLSTGNFIERLLGFFGGTIMSFMKIFHNVK